MTPHIRSHRSLFVVVVAASAMPALAQNPPPRPDPAAMFAKMDTNKDGRVSRAEYVAARSQRFDQLDHDRDGVVTRSDFPRAAGNPQASARLDTLLGEADRNGDGKVTRAELKKAPAPGFDRVDADRDGYVTRAEMDAARPQRR
ncbi:MULTISPECIES: EF-hand domain-containing protein [Sphingomonas]|uniref:EF-hand domain-containing protein n=1 Tax=Sphingomonas molluscorum TaxID=418184 RepID=A0ABU8Q2E4_9SPHN|nr:EF-hand domain-containing protein [Sphingomonas sp. JUb134]MBM7404720.1 Ca2+-binding EF-hand superfamily protein [Sphingomonas sp. JUb134]